MIYIELLLITAVVVFIVDLSGFTTSWKAALGRLLHRDIGQVRPFDCSLCMGWWCGLAYACCTGSLSVCVVAYIALLSYMTRPIKLLLQAIWDNTLKFIDKLFDL